MTPPPTLARTANEQRIAALECELVTMRGALEFVDSKCSIYGPADAAREKIRAALASSDFAGKVVVDREERLQLDIIENLLRAGEKKHVHFELCLARLDALREGGKG